MGGSLRILSRLSIDTAGAWCAKGIKRARATYLGVETNGNPLPQCLNTSYSYLLSAFTRSSNKNSLAVTIGEHRAVNCWGCVLISAPLKLFISIGFNTWSGHRTKVEEHHSDTFLLCCLSDEWQLLWGNCQPLQLQPLHNYFFPCLWSLQPGGCLLTQSDTA